MIRKAGRYIQKAELAKLAVTHTIIDPSVELQWIEQRECHLLLDNPYRSDDGSRAEFLEHHYAHNGRVCAALVDGDLVSWRMFKPQFQQLRDWLEIRGGDGVVFGMAAFTALHARGQRLMAIITAHAAREYLELGYSTLMAATDHNNKAAIAAHMHIGMQKIALITDTRWPLGLRTVRVNRDLKTGFFNHRRRLIHYAS